MFVNAMAQDWQAITSLKVQRAWDLHELLPKDLDFFASLASVSAQTDISGQSIYAGTSVSSLRSSVIQSLHHF